MTGDSYITYVFEDPGDLQKRAESLTKHIPRSLVLNEPGGGIGFSLGQDRFVSKDTLRFQAVVNALFHQRIFHLLKQEAATERNYALEIGAGYGGLANHLAHIVKNLTYFIVDLPETFIFSAPYLALQNPRKSIYLYDHDSCSQFIQSRSFDSYDFVLIPTYRLDQLRALRFDLILNTDSFHEMRTEQVEAYAEFIQKTLRGTFYCWNTGAQPCNPEISNVWEILNRHLDPKSFLKKGKRQRFQNIRYATKNILRSLSLRAKILKRHFRASSPYQEFIWHASRTS